jgi:type IV pilus assembly protein PilB
MTSPESILINPNAISLISNKQAWHYKIIPRNPAGATKSFYIDHSKDANIIRDELELIFNDKVSLEAIESSVMLNLLEKYYKKDQADSRFQASYYHGDADSFLDHLISEAKVLKSSDIHIETYVEKCRVRIRIDGMLVQRYILDRKQYPSLVNKIKIASNLDIAEKRLPQDGRIFFENKVDKFDIRVSVLPTLYGEKIVLRLLNSDAAIIDITTLGFAEADLNNYLEGIKKPNGILLISGPTGSGKTTTLYATLKILNKETKNIITIEDPVEYTLEGVNHVQLKENIGLSFAAALRTFMRQDPNIIMLGEIRDPETANMAIRAALTGHLVLSTIHTNSAWGTVSRLIDMGIPAFLLANTLNTTVAQRLVRLLCPNCKSRQNFKESEFPKKFKPVKKIEYQYVPVGCELCHNTGYKGRKAVYEVIQIDEDLADLIKDGNFNAVNMLKEKGVKTLSDNAFELFEKGLTSLEEIYSLLLN